MGASEVSQVGDADNATIILKRGAIFDLAFQEWALIGRTNYGQRASEQLDDYLELTLELLDENGKTVMRYGLQDAFVRGLIGPSHSSANEVGIAIESLTISCNIITLECS